MELEELMTQSMWVYHQRRSIIIKRYSIGRICHLPLFNPIFKSIYKYDDT